MFEIEPGTLPPHRFAACFPLMSAHEFAELCDVITAVGQQVFAVRFQGQLLDGRNRGMACKELGINLKVVDFIGTEDQAFDYVTNANRFQRDLSKSQHGAIATELMPYISPEMEERRLEKAKATWARKREADGLQVFSPNLEKADGTTLTREIAGAIMGVSGTYVQWALRVKREDPELFLKIWNGQVTINAAIRQLDGITETDCARRIRTLRRELNSFFRDPDPGFLESLERLVAQFRHPG